MSVETFEAGLVGAKIKGTTYHGKWLLTDTSQGYLLINLGMGGELLLVDSEVMPEKWRVRFDFKDGNTFVVNFWWFGNTHYIEPGGLAEHTMTAKLGLNAIDVSMEEFRDLLVGRRGRIKSFLLDQSRIAGIGNAYVHDILFRAKLHPLRTIPTLLDSDIDSLCRAIHDEFERSIAKGAAGYELNLFGEKGGFGADDLLVGYRENKACLECGTMIEKVKTGGTTSYVCPQCQPLKT
ncbi:Fpg/Nei family DNA glycosylase [Candidatus Bipolaricaulota bacterium]|nr:Fpg/Nei family DNA glycosylase [Candidatus Bipolaricaulota bacterium]